MSHDEEYNQRMRDAQAQLDASRAASELEMKGHIAAAESGGLLEPVDGISLEDWAAGNAKLVEGRTLEQVLAVLGVESPAWDAANAEWQGRMSRDTTFAIAKVYGEAFQNSNIGRFASAQRDTGAIPCDFETWVKVGAHMSKGTEQGLDPQAILQSHGMSVSDWSAAGAYWSVEYHKNIAKYADLHTQLHQKYEQQYAAPTVADDIEF
ncbi:MAG: DUF6620 family protein [Myxococcota bacterium]